MKQYTTAMAVIASLLVAVLIGYVVMQTGDDADTTVTTPTTKKVDTTPSKTVDDNDSVDQSVTVPNTDVEQTVTVGE